MLAPTSRDWAAPLLSFLEGFSGHSELTPSSRQLLEGGGALAGST